MQTSSPHIHAENAVAIIMRKVLYALIPGILLSTFFLGIGVLVNCLLAATFALVFEASVLKNSSTSDSSGHYRRHSYRHRDSFCAHHFTLYALVGVLHRDCIRNSYR